MVPSYANLFMGKLEQEFLRTQDKIPRVWWRYIDDIFAIWDHSEPSLRVFIENLNRHHSTIKFTASWSDEEVTFLDTRFKEQLPKKTKQRGEKSLQTTSLCFSIAKSTLKIPLTFSKVEITKHENFDFVHCDTCLLLSVLELYLYSTLVLVIRP